MYDQLVNKYRYGNIAQKKNFYLDEKANIVPNNLQSLFLALSGTYLSHIQEIKMMDSALVIPGNKEKVDDYKNKIKTLLTRCKTVLPDHIMHTRGQSRYNFAMIYREIGENNQAEKEIKDLYEICRKELRYYLKFGTRKSWYTRGLAKDAFDFMQRCSQTASEWKMTNESVKWEKTNKELQSAVNSYVNQD
jgi:hypothetical protein